MKYIIRNPITGKKVVVGELVGNAFYKKVKANQKLQVLNAYGIEATVIEDLREKGCQKIILEEDGKRTYAVNFLTFYTKAIRKRFGNSSRQFYLPLKYWEEVTKEQQCEQSVANL